MEQKTAEPDTIIDRLKERMRSGVYRPGERLVEMDIAEEFGVGRGRVREAFRTLVGEGYLLFLANRGVLVRRYSRAEMLNMGRTREMLEGLAARLAAEREIAPPERETLAALQDEMDVSEAENALDRFSSENRRYHAMICTLADNAHVTDFLARLRVPLFRLQMPPDFFRDSIGRSNADHRTITAAILNGIPDAAEAAMRAHVRAGNAHIATLPDTAF